MIVTVVERRNQIGKLLDERGITRYRLARDTEMSNKAIYDLVAAPQIPEGTAYGTLLKIAEVLGVGVEELEERVTQ